jgi:hypothetical protein
MNMDVEYSHHKSRIQEHLREAKQDSLQQGDNVDLKAKIRLLLINFFKRAYAYISANRINFAAWSRRAWRSSAGS